MTLGRRVREFVDAVEFSVILEGWGIENSRAFVAYRRSAEVDWGAIRMEVPIFLYDISSDRVSGLVDGGSYYGRRIYGLGHDASWQVSVGVAVAWLTESSYIMVEASEAVGEGSYQRQVT